jgi:hypothetical protein
MTAFGAIESQNDIAMSGFNGGDNFSFIVLALRRRHPVLQPVISQMIEL